MSPIVMFIAGGEGHLVNDSHLSGSEWHCQEKHQYHVCGQVAFYSLPCTEYILDHCVCGYAEYGVLQLLGVTYCRLT